MRKSAETVYGDDVPDEVVDRLRKICASLPEAYEAPAWKGARWRVRTQTFAHVLTVAHDGADPVVVLTFRAEGDDLEALQHIGPPFRRLPWGKNAMAIDLDDRTDWDEVGELLTDSFCVMAPKKLVALVARPPAE